MEQNKKRYWFRAKKFGWVPASLEGWVTVILYLGTILFTVWESNPGQTLLKDVIVREAPTWVFAVLVLLGVIWLKGERPRWKILNLVDKLLS